jgi:hypothetical protein
MFSTERSKSSPIEAGNATTAAIINTAAATASNYQNLWYDGDYFRTIDFTPRI